MSETLTLEVLKQAVAGTAAAFRCVSKMQPIGGEGDKVFPPTYAGGQYATELRRVPGETEPVPCVLLNSVQSEANFNELALLDAVEQHQLPVPVISVDFANQGLLKNLRVTSLDAPHRIADALLRDSLLNGVAFRRSDVGQALDQADLRNATGLLEFCPTALVYGVWDSTGPRGGLGVKFARAFVSEIIGMDAIRGMKTSSRIDPAGIVKDAGPLFRTADGGWTLEPNEALDQGGKKVLYARVNGKDVLWDPVKDIGKLPDAGRPSTANHGNVTPDLNYRKDQNNNLIKEDGQPIPIGGFTIRYAQQTTTLSLPALRRLRFPLAGQSGSDPAIDAIARTALATLALCGATLAREGETAGMLRSRCHLFATDVSLWELLDRPGQEPKKFSLNPSEARELLKAAVTALQNAGLPWRIEEVRLTPSPQLVALVKKSQELSASVSGND